MNHEAVVDIAETILTAGITGFAGYVLAAFRKASKADLAELEKRLDAKLRERQTLVIEPLKAQLALIEERLAVAVTNRELDAKFEAIGKRLDDIVALIARRPAE